MLFFKFWISMFLIGLTFYPFTSYIFKKFNDKGWLFSKIIGTAITGWLVWLLSYLKILEFSRLNCYLVLLCSAIVNVIIMYFRLKSKHITSFNSFKDIFNENVLKLIKNIAISEIIFILALIFWFYIKGFAPQVTNFTEQFMDYGYIKIIMDSKYMPPQDLWFSGNSINYYYFGQYISSFMLKMCNLTTSEGYNVINSFIAACTFVLPYSLGLNVFSRIFNTSNKAHKEKAKGEHSKITIYNQILSLIVAVFIGFSVSLGGTLHYPIYRWILPKEQTSYTYVDEARYIGYKPETDDQGVTEVPAYSSIIGDLHAHYIDLIFSFTTLAILLEYFYSNKNSKKIDLYLVVGLLGLILGIEKMTNYWNFPIYTVIISAIVITKEIICKKFSLENFVEALTIIISIIIVEELISLPFTIDLKITATNVLFTWQHSPFYRLAIKWGLQTICVFAFLILFLLKFFIAKKGIKQPPLQDTKIKQTFPEFLNEHLSDLYIIIIGLSAIGLVLLPEVIYLKDIYGPKFKRFNTMFKLSYQAFVLLCVATNYIIFRLMLSKYKPIAYIAIIVLIVNTSTFGYGIDAITTKYKNVPNIGISSDSTENYFATAMPNDYTAVKWIRENIEHGKVILEAYKDGNSYSTYSRISTFTGNPTVLGWYSHEWLWRHTENYLKSNEMLVRADDIKRLYTSSNLDEAKEIIKKYNINYIYVGNLEYETYPSMNIDFLKTLGNVVYNFENVYIIDCNV